MGFRGRLFTLAVFWSLAVVAILPVVLQWPRRPPSWSATSASWLGYAVAAVVSYFIYRRQKHRLSRTEAFSLVLLIFSLTSIVNHIHSFNVDHGRDYFPVMSNEAWQEQLNDSVVRLAPETIPHSYRFLPNSIVRWMQIAGLQFGSARDLYRL